jgi:hypothetical protein
MTEIETKTEAEAEDFTDEMSDEALDRQEVRFCSIPSNLEPDR